MLRCVLLLLQVLLLGPQGYNSRPCPTQVVAGQPGVVLQGRSTTTATVLQ